MSQSNILHGGALKPAIGVIAEGETHDPSTGITTGTSKYLVTFPAIQRMLGLEINIAAQPGKDTKFSATITSLEQNPEIIMRKLYGGK